MTRNGCRLCYDRLTLVGHWGVTFIPAPSPLLRVLTLCCLLLLSVGCTNGAAVGPSKSKGTVGVPVFTADIACLVPDAKVVSHITSDNYGGGKQAAQAMIEALGEARGKVVILDYENAESCILRVKGFKEAIGQYNRARTSGQI